MEDGVGLYQEKGGPVVELRANETIIARREWCTGTAHRRKLAARSLTSAGAGSRGWRK